MLENQPVAFASASLNATQQCYSQIEKEALAVIVGLKKFHHYIYGTAGMTTVHTDHQPLISIFFEESGLIVTPSPITCAEVITILICSSPLSKKRIIYCGCVILSTTKISKHRG